MQIRSLAAAVATPRGSRLAKIAIVAALIVGVLVWWWYPQLSNESATTDVAIVGDSFLQSAEHEVTQRIHEDGFTLDWAVGGGPRNATEASAPVTTSVPVPDLTWCDAAAAVRDEVARVHPSFVVVSFAEEGTCGTDPVAVRSAVADAAGSAKLIVVADPGTEGAAPLPPHAVVVEPSQLLGADGTLQQGCLWFDACPPDGRIDVREADGRLTISGQTRIARLIVTALR